KKRPDMKTILVPTDFSPAAENAALYALNLAKAINTGIKLFNAFKVPMETPLAAQVMWPLEDYDSLKDEVTDDLKRLAKKLSREAFSRGGSQPYRLPIEYSSEAGSVSEMVCEQAVAQRLGLVVMGMSGAGALSRLFLGSNSKELIDKATFPVLLVPPHAVFKGINKIAFASDLSDDEIEVIHSLAGFAYKFNAEMLIAHVTDEKYEMAHQHKVDSFLSDITGKINYPKIYYRHIKSLDVDHGLDWLTEHGQVDILAMVHKKHNWVEQIFEGSHTQKLAKHVEVPLLVFPAGY